MAALFRLDKYTVFHERVDHGTFFAFNFRTGALALLTKETRDEILRLSDDAYHPSINDVERNIDFIKSFMITAGADEAELVRNYFYNTQNKDDEINLTVLTTLACNFSCFYCYERREANRLSQEVESSIIDLARKRSQDLSRFGICWYGGEPLLVKDSIIRVNNQLYEILQRHNVHFYSKIVTNGYLLTSKTAEELYNSGVSEVQISFDGPRRIHDVIRHQSGKPTFDRIVDNIRQCRDKFRFIIRVNVNNDNCHHIDELIDQLNEEGVSDYTTIYFANLHSNGVGCSDMSEPQLDSLIKNQDFLRQMIAFKNYALQRGFQVRTPLSTKTLCSAVTKGGLVIEPTGEAKKCYLDVGNKSENIPGGIGSLGNAAAQNNKWVSYDPFANADCAKCRVLPICYSGCPWEAMRNVPTYERCHPLKTALDDYLEFFFSWMEKGAHFDQKYKTLQLRPN